MRNFAFLLNDPRPAARRGILLNMANSCCLSENLSCAGKRICADIP